MKLAFSFKIPQDFTYLEQDKEDQLIKTKIWKLRVGVCDDDGSLGIELHSEYPGTLPNYWYDGRITLSVPNHKNSRNDFTYTTTQTFRSFNNDKNFRFNKLDQWMNPTNGFVENGHFLLNIDLSIDYSNIFTDNGVDKPKNLKFDEFSKENLQRLDVERAAKKVDENDENVDPNPSKMDTSSRFSPGKLIIDHNYLDEKFGFSFATGRFKETMCEWTMIPRSCDSTGNLFVTVQCHEQSKSNLWSYKLVFLHEIRSEKNPIQTFRRQSFAEFDIRHKSIDIFIGKMSRFRNAHFISKSDNKIRIHGRLTALRKCGVRGRWLEPLWNADLKKVALSRKMLDYQLILAQRELQKAEKLAEEDADPRKAQRECEKSKKSAKIAEISFRILDSKDIQNVTGEQILGCLELGAKFHYKRFLEKIGNVLVKLEMPLEQKLEFAVSFKLVELQEHCLEELKK